jgi:hypothetical protein
MDLPQDIKDYLDTVPLVTEEQAKQLADHVRSIGYITRRKKAVDEPTPETDAFEKSIHPAIRMQTILEYARKLERERNKLRYEVVTLQVAAQAVIDRWDSPPRKDAEPTARVMNRLRNAISENNL